MCRSQDVGSSEDGALRGAWIPPRVQHAHAASICGRFQSVWTLWKSSNVLARSVAFYYNTLNRPKRPFTVSTTPKNPTEFYVAAVRRAPPEAQHTWVSIF